MIIPIKSHMHLGPHVVIRILLTVSPRLCFTSPWLFCNNQSVLLSPFTFHPSPDPPPSWQLSECSLYLWVCFCSACLIILFFEIELLMAWYLLPFYCSYLYLLLKKRSLIFHVTLVWWWCTPLTFTCLVSSLYALRFSTLSWPLSPVILSLFKMKILLCLRKKICCNVFWL